MNFAFLPGKIKEELKDIAAEKVPLSIARSSASIEGRPGEGYIVAFDDRLFIFSRELGEHEYSNISAGMSSIGGMSVKKEGINSFLDLDIGEKAYSMKFSSFEEVNLKSIQDAWAKEGGGANLANEASASTMPKEEYPGKPAAIVEPFSSKVGLAAALMYVASVDGEIAKEEDYYIIAIMGNNRAVLNAGLVYYKSHSFDELLTDLKGISEDEVLCFLANMMELGMTDGTLHSSEMNLIRKFSDYMKVDDSQYNTIKQVLLIKNKISVLGT